MPGEFKSVTIGGISDFSVEIEAKLQDNVRAERAVEVTTTDAPKHDVAGDHAMPNPQFIAPPAFQLYASDFLGSSKVGRMSLTEIGIFTLLLCHSWNANGLPLALPEIARMARVQPRRFERLWKGVLSECWIVRRGRYVNPRQEEIRSALIAYRAKQRDNGVKGGRPRNPDETQKKPNGKPNTKPRTKPNETSPISDLPNKDVSKEQKHPVAHPIKEFLTLYETLFERLCGSHPAVIRC
jgi:uncharacterized protein YdaU (DUF1376 family)